MFLLRAENAGKVVAAFLPVISCIYKEKCLHVFLCSFQRIVLCSLWILLDFGCLLETMNSCMAEAGLAHCLNLRELLAASGRPSSCDRILC